MNQIKNKCRFFLSDQLVTHLSSVRQSIPENKIVSTIFGQVSCYSQISISYLDMSSDKNDEIFYYPASKIEEEASRYKDSYYFRVKGTSSKVGRVFRKVLEDLGYKTSDKEIEEFVNAYKQVWESTYGEASFEIVSGEEIRKSYLIQNYCEKAYRYNYGTLGSSCMAATEKQELLEIYVNNPEICQLIIRKDDKGKITSRALLWTLSNGEKYMDRVYYTYDYQDKMFKSWFTKTYPNCEFYVRGKNNTNISVQLKKWKYKLYPYMDTFGYLNWRDGILLTSIPKDLSYDGPYALLSLTHTSGIPSTYNNFRWSEYEKRWVSVKNSFYDEDKKSYRTNIKFRKIKKFLPFLRGEFED